MNDQHIPSNQKLYAERDHYQLSPQYERHLLAMTAEGLYSKSAIAAELAYRDIEIERLRPMAESWESYEAAQERKAEMQPVETSADKATLDEWLRIEARLHASLTRRFGSDAVSAAVAEVCADIRAHNPLVPPVEPTPNQDGQQTPAPSGHAGLGTTGQSPSAVRSSENGPGEQEKT